MKIKRKHWFWIVVVVAVVWVVWVVVVAWCMQPGKRTVGSMEGVVVVV